MHKKPFCDIGLHLLPIVTHHPGFFSQISFCSLLCHYQGLRIGSLSASTI